MIPASSDLDTLPLLMQHLGQYCFLSESEHFLAIQNLLQYELVLQLCTLSATLNNFSFLPGYRITGVGRDLRRSSSPTPLLKQIPYNRSHRWASRWVLNISTEVDSTTFMGNLFHCSIILTRKFFHTFEQNFLPRTNHLLAVCKKIIKSILTSLNFLSLLTYRHLRTAYQSN